MKVLIDLDSLYETRIVNTSLLSTQAAAKLLLSGYFARQTDDVFWADVSETEWKKRWKKRNSEHLKQARLTNMLEYLAELVSAYLFEQGAFASSEGVHITLNVYPYVLSDEERTAFKRCLEWSLGSVPQVTVVNYPLEKLSPEFLNQHFTHVILYTFQDWLFHHFKALEKRAVPMLTMIVPKLYIEVPPDDLSAVVGQDAGPLANLDIHTATELFMSYALGLRFIHVGHFSVTPSLPPA